MKRRLSEPTKGSAKWTDQKEETAEEKCARLVRQVRKLEDDKVLLKLEVVSLNAQVDRLEPELATAIAEASFAKQESRNCVEIAANAAVEVVQYKTMVEMLKHENKTLVEGRDSVMEELEERCRQLEYERSHPLNTTRILEDERDWYRNSLMFEQNRVQEERQKSKTAQIELKDRIASLVEQVGRVEGEKTALEKLLSQERNEKTRLEMQFSHVENHHSSDHEEVLEKLKTSDEACNKLMEENIRIVKELTDSLNAREKLNTMVDESESSLKESRGMCMNYLVELNNAKDHIQVLEKEKEEMQQFRPPMIPFLPPPLLHPPLFPPPCPPFGTQWIPM